MMNICRPSLRKECGLTYLLNLTSAQSPSYKTNFLMYKVAKLLNKNKHFECLQRSRR